MINLSDKRVKHCCSREGASELQLSWSITRKRQITPAAICFIEKERHRSHIFPISKTFCSIYWHNSCTALGVSRNAFIPILKCNINILRGFCLSFWEMVLPLYSVIWEYKYVIHQQNTIESTVKYFQAAHCCLTLKTN